MEQALSPTPSKQNPMADKNGYDREKDPEVQKRRNELFHKYVVPSFRFIDYLCVKYASNPKNIVESKYRCLEHLFRVIETYDPSRYSGMSEKRAWQNWCHIICKRHIAKMEENMWKEEQLHSNDVEIENVWDSDGICLDKEHSSKILELEGFEDELSDPLYNVYQNLSEFQRDAFVLIQHGYSIPEIREIEVRKGTLPHELNYNAIKQRIHRTKNYIKEHVTPYGQPTAKTKEQAIEEDMPEHNPEDEFQLKVYNPE